MNILISNDDGYLAAGLSALVEGFKGVATTTVVAPDRNRSGASNSLTLQHPLRVQQAENGYYYVDGTPTDCVHLAVTGFMDQEPDMVISGINHGANLGDDILYSGTVAAAMEGRFLGFPALAISLVGDPCRYFSTAVQVVTKLYAHIQNRPLAAGVILNVNVPDCPEAELQGWAATRLGHRHRAESVIADTDPQGQRIYWVGSAGSEADAGPGTDFYALAHGQVSITPLHIDLTQHRELPGLAQWCQELG
ncbi:MAG TPA: 5'/3'-nucleotidase SurE [Gammaproteobacteria bacterium]|nr:5'/3'-nucleotidase SurE [Gammaproteobacteria bacterium]